MMSTVLRFLNNLLSLKTYKNISTVSNKQKNLYVFGIESHGRKEQDPDSEP